jgi:hypothetical protein
MFLDSSIGKLFRSESGLTFGPLRSVVGRLPDVLRFVHGDTFAADDCGNYFVTQNARVLFWDHETGEFNLLADSTQDFFARLEEPRSAVLKPGQVKRAWIDPTFAKNIASEPDEG